MAQKGGDFLNHEPLGGSWSANLKAEDRLLLSKAICATLRINQPPYKYI